ncbi:MAG: glpC 2 [Gemmataceae bacterium]|nr:glpC 2 [Gemmataceae bacterium]
MPDSDQIADDLRNSFRGRLTFDGLVRGLYSTDASPFQVTPLGVAIPQDADDLAVLVRYCFEHQIPLIPRGAGTGVAGESLGPGLVVDLSVHFRRVLDISSDAVTVEPGVVLVELNAALAKHGRRFGPDPASGGSCTVGGMVATNASGGNASRYGYTRDYVSGLGVVWDNGESSFVLRPSSSGLPPGWPDQLDPPTGEGPGTRDQGPRTRDILSATEALLKANRELVHLTRPQTAFNRCGYLLHDVLTDAGLDLAKLLAGSEGTLGFVTAATLRTVPLPGGVCITLLGFATLDAALRAGLDVRAAGPVGCDLLDRRLLSRTRSPGPAQAVGLVPPSVGAALVVTFEGDTEREAADRAWGAIDQLRATHRLGVLAEPTCDPEGTARVRGVREAAVAGLYGLGKGPRPVAFIEDVGVPTEALAEFVAQTQDVLQRFELSASFLVHTLAGQVHTRPLVDLDDPADRAKLWPVAEAVHGLALALGGTVSTQHGTGIARTPWVEKQYGPVLPVFREVKRIFDPKGILNPGKIIGPDPSRPAWPLRSVVSGQGSGVSPNLDQDTGSKPGDSVSPPTPDSRLLTPLLVWPDGGPVAEATKCTGCGDCRSRSPRGRMCPVFRATGAEEASPRAMANLVRLLTDPAALAGDDVKAIADGCVNCKMCRDECPARVDVSKLMLEAKAARQAEHGLTRADWVLARTEMFATLGSNFAPLVNGLLSRRSVRWLIEKVFGLSRRRRLQAFSLRSFYRRARGMGLTKKYGARTADRGPEDPSSSLRIPHSAFRVPKVAYFVDVFANYNDPLIGEATVAVLRHHGVEVYVPPRQVGCGMAPLAVGDVETAREVAVRNVRALADLVREGYRVVCSEPTAALMLSQDYLNILTDPDAATLAANTVELTTFLWELHQAGRLKTDFRRLDVTLGHHVPCHLKALHGPAAGPQLLALIPGVRVHTIDVSCSGMAGTWGLKAANYETSLAAGRRMLEELNRPGVLFGSTECSACRMQMQEGTGKRSLHPVQYLAHAYGLLPELGAKLRKPLGKLVSD